ncbi:hypothetical protein [Archangium lansingense]|uniref:SH3 domain-containing protein n=1 Tax=Archangium lansingense TaxID=2995310 RepID=A0ABT4ALE9_9BACT|nr:hypothetical protein [Archangium lansinium]MCY1082505.1 hypothetical protein [Archangium lansinium]
METLQSGTECRITEKLEGDWLKLQCGGREGYAPEPLFGAEMPSSEQRAEEATKAVSGSGGVSAVDLIQKNYSARYAGPAPVPLAPEVAPVTLAVPTVAQALHDWYAAEIRKDNKALARKLRKLKAKAYNNVLAQRRTKALECVTRLPAELQPQVEAFLAASEAEAQDASVRKLQEATEGQPREVLDCVDAAVVKLDSRGVLVGGLTWGKTAEGTEKLKPTRYSPGLAFILRPQVLTAWPGRADSALRVIDPRQGPWKVLLAHTYGEKTGTHRERWKRLKATQAADYLQQKNNGNILLVDEADVPLGWLDMDQAAFYEEEWAASADISKPVFTSGIAAFVQGVWWNPQGFSEAGGAGGVATTRYQDSVYVIDFLRLVKLETSQTSVPVRNPYSEPLQSRQLRKLYQGEGIYENELKVVAECRGHPDFLWSTGEELGSITVHKGRLQYKLKTANVRTTLRKLYRLR